MGKKLKTNRIYWMRSCYYCGKPVRNDVPYYSYCSPECEVRIEIEAGEFLIGDPYLIKLGRN